MDLEAGEEAEVKCNAEGSFSWHDITCSYLPPGARSEKAAGGKAAVQVLHGIHGHVAQGDFLAVLGGYVSPQ